MPLSQSSSRQEIHHRQVNLKAYHRDDGMFDIEAHLVDTKPFPFERLLSEHPAPAGSHLHDLWLRMVVDGNYIVQSVEAASDSTPYAVCKEAGAGLSVLVGERVGRGWSKLVKDKLRGAAGCTHLNEMLLPMATAAIQGIRGIRREELFSNDETGKPHKLNSCYAYATHREVVRVTWPEHYRPS